MGNDTVEPRSVQEKVKSRSNTQERNVSGALVRAYLRSCFGNKQVGSVFPFPRFPRQTAAAAPTPRLKQ